VQQILDGGADPNNGYSAAVLRDYRRASPEPVPAAPD
jgi:hypothetical protein